MTAQGKRQKAKGKSKRDWIALSFLLPFAFCLFSWIPSASTCPDCKEALFDPGQIQQKRSTARGYAVSIGMLLTVPAGLVGGITTLILKSRRR